MKSPNGWSIKKLLKIINFLKDTVSYLLYLHEIKFSLKIAYLNANYFSKSLFLNQWIIPFCLLVCCVFVVPSWASATTLTEKKLQIRKWKKWNQKKGPNLKNKHLVSWSANASSCEMRSDAASAFSSRLDSIASLFGIETNTKRQLRAFFLLMKNPTELRKKYDKTRQEQDFCIRSWF